MKILRLRGRIRFGLPAQRVNSWPSGRRLTARFQEFNLLAAHKGAIYRVAKVIFGSDGSIYLIFPKFRHNEGLVSICTLRDGSNPSTSVSLTEQGKMAGHLVKYSHRVNGDAHFSQHGKVKTFIRKMSDPLTTSPGHFFTIQAQRLSGFAPPKRGDKAPRLTMNIEGEVKTLKVTGWWYNMNLVPYQGPGPPQAIMGPDGVTKRAFFVAPPEGEPFQDWMLVLVPELVPLLSPDGEPSLTFIGGFDTPQMFRDDPNGDVRFLALMYPAEDSATLRREIGTIDLRSRTYEVVRSG